MRSIICVLFAGCLLMQCNKSPSSSQPQPTPTPTSFDNTCFNGSYTIAQYNDTLSLKGCFGEDGKIVELIINDDDTMQCSGGVSAAGSFNVSGTVTQLAYTLNVQFTGTLQGDSTYYTGSGTWSETMDTTHISGTWEVITDPGVNLLIDPSFENQDTANWRGAISGGRSIVNTGAESGTYCEKMVMDTIGFPRCVWQTIKGITEGKVYTISGWMKTQDIVFSVHIAVYWYDTLDPPASMMPSGYILADTLVNFSGTNPWGMATRNYRAPANALSAQFFLEGVAVKHNSSTGNNGTAWFDNLSFAVH